VLVLFIDLDGFKLVNDTLGHAAGDQLLTIVANRFANTMRSSDVLARMGGDEFAVLVSDFDKDSCEKLATKIVKAATFFPAEVYHQDYYHLNGNRDSYCRNVIAPKIEKIGLTDKPKIAK